MAKKSESPAESFIDAVAEAPWWLGAFLAVASYAGLHHFATRPPVVDATKTNELLTKTMLHTGAVAGQWLLPALFTLGALQSAIVSSRRKRRLQSALGDDAVSAINSMSWREFESLVGEAYRRKGFTVRETGNGADGGVDLVLTKEREVTIVQCKHWRATSVGVAVVRELFGVMAAQGATACVVVTSGRFSQAATEFASGRNVELIGGPALLRLIGNVPRVEHKSASVAIPSIESFVSSSSVDSSSQGAPQCPNCTETMIIRTARRGPTPGNQFWGCPSYPRCHGIRQTGSRV
jgi:restriction system protein